MRLSFSGAPEVAAPRDVVWKHLMDPDFVAQSAPGVEQVEQVDPEHFKVVSALGVGAVKVRFTLDVALSDVVPPRQARMTARGKAPGSAVEVDSFIELEDAPDGKTIMRWKADSEVSGTVASVGGRLLEGTARRLSEAFWTDFAQRVGAAARG